MKQAKVLTDAEIKRVLAVIDAGRHKARNRIAFMLSHLAGLRVGEIASLTVGDVIDRNGNVRHEIRLRAEATKTRDARTVFISKKLRRELVRFKSVIGKNPNAELPLLITQKGTPFSGNTLCQLLGSIYRRAGVEGATSHSGRRGFITKLAHKGISAKVIMSLVGHRNLSTTQRYIEVNDAMMREAVEVV